MMHPDTCLKLVSEEIGYGVFVTRRLPRGTLIWIQDQLDIEITAPAVQELPEPLQNIMHHYAFINTAGRYVLCWDAGRYVNHSCNPSTVSIGNFCTIAAHDIEPGEQITEDYATLNIGQNLQCLCGSKSCRGLIAAEDLPLIAARLDVLSSAAVLDFGNVPQSLLSLVKPELQEILYSAAKRQITPPSCLDNRRQTA